MEGKRVTFDGNMLGVIVEMSILDGNKYDQTFPDGAPHCDVDGLSECALLMGNEVSTCTGCALDEIRLTTYWVARK